MYFVGLTFSDQIDINSNKPQYMISIITVCWNNLCGLKATHDSIRAQSFRDYEWIVIDGGSSDGTVEYLKNIARPDFYVSETDNGIYDAMNKGFSYVRGDLIIYLNSGDVFLEPSSLGGAVDLILTMKSKADVFLFDYALKLPNGFNINKSARTIDEYIWHGMPTNHQSILFSRDVIRCFPYDLSYKICGDYYLLARIFNSNYKVMNINATLCTFEVGGTSFQKPWALIKESYMVKVNILELSWSVRLTSLLKSVFSIYGLKLLSLKWIRY